MYRFGVSVPLCFSICFLARASSCSFVAGPAWSLASLVSGAFCKFADSLRTHPHHACVARVAVRPPLFYCSPACFSCCTPTRCRVTLIVRLHRAIRLHQWKPCAAMVGTQCFLPPGSSAYTGMSAALLNALLRTTCHSNLGLLPSRVSLRHTIHQ